MCVDLHFLFKSGSETPNILRTEDLIFSSLKLAVNTAATVLYFQFFFFKEKISSLRLLYCALLHGSRGLCKELILKRANQQISYQFLHQKGCKAQNYIIKFKIPFYKNIKKYAYNNQPRRNSKKIKFSKEQFFNLITS